MNSKSLSEANHNRSIFEKNKTNLRKIENLIKDLEDTDERESLVIEIHGTVLWVVKKAVHKIVADKRDELESIIKKLNNEFDKL